MENKIQQLLFQIKGYEYIILASSIVILFLSILFFKNSSSPKKQSSTNNNINKSINNKQQNKNKNKIKSEEIKETSSKINVKNKESPVVAQVQPSTPSTNNNKNNPTEHKLFFKSLRAGDIVNSLKISPDGKYLSFCGLDRSIKMFLYDTMVATTKTPPQSFSLQLPYDNATNISWGDKIIYATLNESQKLIAFSVLDQKNQQGKSYEQLWSVSLEQKSLIKSICSNEKSPYIITLSEDTIIKVWTLKGQLIQTINASQIKAFNASMSPDGRFFGISSFSSEVKIYEALNKKGQIECKRVMSLTGYKMSIYSIFFNSNGLKVITSSKDGCIKLWSLNVKYELDVDPELQYSIMSENGVIDILSISPDDQVIAGVNQNYICFFNFSNGNIIDTISLSGSNNISINSIVWSKDSKYLITGGNDKQLYFWKNPKKLD